MTEKPKPSMQKFIDQHAPKVPDFIKSNLPRFDPGFRLGPPAASFADKTLLDVYFPDLRPLVADVHGRPDHYTVEQRELVDLLWNKKPLPPGTTKQDLNELVLRFTERTEHVQRRDKVMQAVQKKIEEADPTIKRILQRAEDEKRQEQDEKKSDIPLFGADGPDVIKII